MLVYTVIIYSFGWPQLQMCINTTFAKVVASKKNDLTDKFVILDSEEYFNLYMLPGVPTLLK